MAAAQPTAVANDRCSQAKNVPVSLPFMDRNVNITTATSDRESCGSITESDIGVWYTYKSDNDTVVQVDIDSRTFVSNLAVFAGPCDNLNCLDNITTSWVAYAGIEYRILVAGSAASTGSFTITLSAVRSSTIAIGMLSHCTGDGAIHIPS